ncbi:MAG: nucleotide sugar dehydrogenase [Acidobacteriaceae bacterium]
MILAVVGLGYVGTVSAASFAAAGHTVWGVDINAEKVHIINSGSSPIVEPGLKERIAAARSGGHLRATCDLREALKCADACFVAVATPSRPSGEIDTTHLMRACEQIAEVMSDLDRPIAVVIRSSILPSVFDQCSDQFSIGARGLVGLCVNPEFLREGSALSDFENPSFTLLGVEDKVLESTLRSLYRHIAAPVIVLPPREALMVKYASNSFHALKTAFANEIGILCSEAGVDGQAVMSAFCRDTKLNISERYLRPGFAFGGSCLPKDVRAILHAAAHYDLDLPLMETLLASNEAVIDRAFRRILSTGSRRIGLIGLAFKANTDDLRESPFVELAERLLGKGRILRIYDPNVALAKIMGANKRYINEAIPHLSSVLVDSLDELSSCDLIVVGHRYSNVDAFLRTVDVPTMELDVTAPLIPAISETLASIA